MTPPDSAPSAPKHTPEPWAVFPTESPTLTRENCVACLYVARNLEDEAIARTKGSHAYATDEQRANLHRIVACVNAMSGVSDPAAMLEKVRDEIGGARNAIISALEALGYDPSCLTEAESALDHALALLPPIRISGDASDTPAES